ncbi:hypothetical protein [Aliihoeflea sp. 40Bstr573]|uniref:hypothetical protein n=1 Tax=Aliihoeflea sp. 40Bstr573 TaxID=2696467 RepID=UPI002095EE8B|nr:hypothetical protein [Aliihoeflea sp. 40Bstr573]MCO6385653.1 hypothetical protein [Aliihoeflea sp. 40Bstr573]
MAVAEKMRSAGRVLAGMFGLGAQKQPLETADMLADFVATRSAYVSQKKLYGYLKTRMGTRYPTMFEDEQFIASINIAKAHVFAACLSDMTLFAVADVGAQGRLSRDGKDALARQCFQHGLDANADQLAHADAAAGWNEAFEARLADVQWDNAAAGGDVFGTSPATLVEWAPIAPQLKAYDREIVENSLKFAWIEIRREYRRLIDPEAVAADFRQQM